MTARNYNPAIGERICTMIADGSSLGEIERMAGYPSRRSMRDWLSQHPDFEKKYEIARKERADNLVDEMVALADSVAGCDDNAKVLAARLAIDTRKWISAKLLPARYGDKITQEVTGPGGADLIPATTDPSRVAMILLGILQRSRPLVDDIDEPVDQQPVLDPAPRRLTPPVEPLPAAVLPSAAGSVPLGSKRPPPPPRWGSDGNGRIRHSSELQQVPK